MEENNILAKTICKFINEYWSKGGIIEVTPPTGFGKTFAVLQVISAMTSPYRERSLQEPKRFIFTTTLKKNLPYEKLRKFYKGDFEKEVLFLKSNLDALVDFYVCGKLDKIPESFKNEDYFKMAKRLAKLKTLQNKNNRDIDDNDYINELKDLLNEDEQKFRKHVNSILNENFKNTKEKKKAIQRQAKYKWIATLYPYIFIKDKKVIFMTMSKLLLGISPIAGSGNSLLTEDFLKDSVLFIDEYDATKQDIKKVIIEAQIKERIDLIRVFRDIHNVIHSDRFSFDLLDVLKEDQYNLQDLFIKIKDSSDSLYNMFNLGLSYRQKEEFIDRKKNFLFYDSQFQTILEEGKFTIYAKEDESRHRMSIIKDSNTSYPEDAIAIQDILRKIDAFMKRFSYLIWRWANAYMIRENDKRKKMAIQSGVEMDEMVVENAAFTIMDKFLPHKDEKKIIYNYYSKINKQSFNKGQLLPYSYFANGFTMFELEDNDANNDDTMMQMTKIKDTPESIMDFISNNALVFAISATANIPSATGNYCIDFLKGILHDKYHNILEEDKTLSSQICAQLHKHNQPYINGNISINIDKISEDNELVKKKLINIFNNKEMAKLCLNRIENEVSILGDSCDYYEQKYIRLAYILRDFAKHKSQQTLLYLGKALPQNTNGSTMNLSVLDYILDLVNKDEKLSIDDKIGNAVLNGTNFEESKYRINERLRNGEKLIIYSSYSTVGAGQNLQYPISDKYREYLVTLPHDYNSEQEERDIDSIYLDDITYLIENLYDSEHFSLVQNLRHQMQVMECYGNYEISVEEKRKLIKAGFNRLQNKKCLYMRFSLADTKSIKLQITRDVIQAIGRIGRTFIRNKEITIYIYEKVLSQLDKEILLYEFNSEEIKSLGKYLQDKMLDINKQLQFTMLRANTISTQVSCKIMSIITRSFKGEWSSNDINLWKKMREVTLKFNTANENDYEQNELIRGYYINGQESLSGYLFSVKDNSYKNIHVWFGSEESFKKSTFMIKDNDNHIIIHKCSEEDCRLQTLLRYRGMKEMFEINGYSTKFIPQKYIMSPALYTNIYKGALGEVAGKFIIEDITTLKLSDIEDGKKFEYFDFKVDNMSDVYIDFKYWHTSSALYNDNDYMIKKIRSKMTKIGAKKVYIIGILKESESEPFTTSDGMITIIPYLIDELGLPVNKMITILNKI